MVIALLCYLLFSLNSGSQCVLRDMEDLPRIQSGDKASNESDSTNWVTNKPSEYLHTNEKCDQNKEELDKVGQNKEDPGEWPDNTACDVDR